LENFHRKTKDWFRLECWWIDGWPKFWKVNSVVIWYCKSSSELTFENFSWIGWWFSVLGEILKTWALGLFCIVKWVASWRLEKKELYSEIQDAVYWGEILKSWALWLFGVVKWVASWLLRFFWSVAMKLEIAVWCEELLKNWAL